MADMILFPSLITAASPNRSYSKVLRGKNILLPPEKTVTKSLSNMDLEGLQGPYVSPFASNFLYPESG